MDGLIMLMKTQAFINYNFLYARFFACKTILGARPRMWQIVPVKEQMCMSLLII